MTESQMNLSVMVMGFSVLFVFMRMMWTNLNNRLDKIDEKITDIDRRLCRLEGAFSSKECCILNHKENKEAK